MIPDRPVLDNKVRIFVSGKIGVSGIFTAQVIVVVLPNEKFFFFFGTAAAVPQVCGTNSKLGKVDLENLFNRWRGLWFHCDSQRHFFKVENGKQLEKRFDGDKRLFLHVLCQVVCDQLIVLGDVATQAAVIVNVVTLTL